MMTYTKKGGTTDVSVVIRIIDLTTGQPELGVVWDTAGIDMQYRREGAANVAITVEGERTLFRLAGLSAVLGLGIAMICLPMITSIG